MSREFQDLMLKIARAIRERTISLPPRKTKDYEEGTYNPFFSLIDRDGELKCMWCGNRRRPDKDGKGGDIEIIRIRTRDLELGLATDFRDPMGWDKITLRVMHYLNGTSYRKKTAGRPACII